uniref:EGF-like domain-containing protein n=1 Tax=Hucho hucho TaxID=62062 RepID=A0A4W5MP69_9TELE
MPYLDKLCYTIALLLPLAALGYLKSTKRNDRHGNAFFALRSCHQVMRGKSGEFFSPDYLCSNPPLWCNWTIQVDPGKRVHLHLEDFTQSDACSGKLDQIHLDEPLGVAGGHRILEKCWREAKYTSLSNILHVVQLIGGKPIAPHRGFYGRYEAFVPPVTYNAYGDTTEEDWKLMTEPKLKELEPFPSLGSFTKAPNVFLDCKQILVFLLHKKGLLATTDGLNAFFFKRFYFFINRLSAGVLYILWLHIGGGPEGVKVHRTLHPALQELLERVVSPRGSSTQGVIVSVSTADVNECVTQLVLCDINAECVNHFGSYECRCHSGFEDMSRLGSGGTICVDTKAADMDSGMIKGIYATCFLLSFLIVLLLGTVGVLYHRHHRGAFMVHCRSSSLRSVPTIPPPDYKNDGNDNRSIRTDSELPPPLPPIRRPKEGWAHPKDCCPSADLPLLRFSPLLPLDGYMEKLHNDKGR